MENMTGRGLVGGVWQSRRMKACTDVDRQPNEGDYVRYRYIV